MHLFTFTNTELRLETRSTDAECEICQSNTISGELGLTLNSTHGELAAFCWQCTVPVVLSLSSHFPTKYYHLCIFFFFLVLTHMFDLCPCIVLFFAAVLI